MDSQRHERDSTHSSVNRSERRKTGVEYTVQQQTYTSMPRLHKMWRQTWPFI